MSAWTKIKKKLKSGTWYPFYNTFYEKVPIDRREILLASRSGISLESNILAILTELSRPEYRKFRKVLAVQKSSREQIEKKLAHYHISVDKIVHMSTPDYYYNLQRPATSSTTPPSRDVISRKKARFISTSGTVPRSNAWDRTTRKNAMTWEISCEIS